VCVFPSDVTQMFVAYILRERMFVCLRVRVCVRACVCFKESVSERERETDASFSTIYQMPSNEKSCVHTHTCSKLFKSVTKFRLSLTRR